MNYVIWHVHCGMSITVNDHGSFGSFGSFGGKSNGEIIF
jgi:hypothetical protein